LFIGQNTNCGLHHSCLKSPACWEKKLATVGAVMQDGLDFEYLIYILTIFEKELKLDKFL
jgi:hypothetical protein